MTQYTQTYVAKNTDAIGRYPLTPTGIVIPLKSVNRNIMGSKKPFLTGLGSLKKFTVFNINRLI